MIFLELVLLLSISLLLLLLFWKSELADSVVLLIVVEQGESKDTHEVWGFVFFGVEGFLEAEETFCFLAGLWRGIICMSFESWVSFRLLELKRLFVSEIV